MNISLKNDAEAWKFLIEMGGDFRIHTNRNGLKVYICVLNRKYSGYYKYFRRRWDLSSKPDKNSCATRPAYIHQEDIVEFPNGYQNSISGKTLVEIVNAHIKNMSGNIYVPEGDFEDFEKQIQEDKARHDWTLEFKGSLEDFKKLSETCS